MLRERNRWKSSRHQIKLQARSIVALLVIPVVLTACGSSQVSTNLRVSSLQSATPSPVTSSTRPTTSTTLHACSMSVDLGHWTNSQLAAQMLVTSADVSSLADAMQAVGSGVGGVVLMGNAVSNSLGSQIASLDRHGPDGIKPLIMTDEEGGGVQRLRALVGSMPWPRRMASTMSPKAVATMAFNIGSKMASLGVAVDLAPVVDLDAGSGPSNVNPDGKRSFSPQSSITVKFASAFIEGLKQAGIIPVIKHFPGLGQASGNTDVMAAHTLPYPELVDTGLIPFEKLASSVPMVMVSNASVPGLSRGVPSSMSRRVISILRNVVGFRGITISDSLETVSISTYQPSLPKAVVDAAVAGVDMIMLASSNPLQYSSFSAAKNALSQAIARNILPRSTAEKRVGEILNLKGVSKSCIYY